jgi:hypothetical protein
MNGSGIICNECGIEFEDYALWQVEGSATTKCPTCRVTAPATYQQNSETTTFQPAPGTLASAGEAPTPTEILLRSQRCARWVVSFVALLFVVACGLPAVSIWEDLPPRTGLWCLILGFPSCFVWFPNPLLLFGSIALLRGRNRKALISGLTACVCCVPGFLYMAVGGGFHRMHSGYFLWQADIFVFSVAAFGMTLQFGENPGRTDRGESESQLCENNSSW